MDHNKEDFLSLAYFSTVDLVDHGLPAPGEDEANGPPVDGQELQPMGSTGGTRYVSLLRDPPNAGDFPSDEVAAETDLLLRHEPSAGDGETTASPQIFAQVKYHKPWLQQLQRHLSFRSLYKLLID